MIAQLRTRSVPALERGLAVLELVAKSNGGLTLRELSQALPLPRSLLVGDPPAPRLFDA